MEKNEIGETTAARVRKGNTGEIVYRHTSSLIYLLSDNLLEAEEPPPVVHGELPKDSSKIAQSVRPKRQAAKRGQELIKTLIRQDKV